MPDQPLPPPRSLLPPQPDVAPPLLPLAPAEMALTTPVEHMLSFQAEGAFIFPVIRQYLRAPVNVGNFFTDTVTLPTADMDLGGAVLFNLRYKGLGPGVLSASYRLLASEGNNVLSGIDPTGDVFLRSRLNMNTIDLDYGNHPRELGPAWLLKWDVGARIATVYFDSFATGPLLDLQTTNYFVGAGPHASVALTRKIGDLDLALYGKVDGSFVFGQVRQQFSETVFDFTTPVAFGYTAQSATRGVPVLSAQIGLSGAPCNGRWGRWQVGYQFEEWWSIGDVGASRADLILHGIFGRWTYVY